MTLHYLVVPGTNLRACGLDREPVICDDRALDGMLNKFERIMGESLAGMPIDEYHERYTKPHATSKAAAKRQGMEDVA